MIPLQMFAHVLIYWSYFSDLLLLWLMISQISYKSRRRKIFIDWPKCLFHSWCRCWKPLTKELISFNLQLIINIHILTLLIVLFIRYIFNINLVWLISLWYSFCYNVLLNFFLFLVSNINAIFWFKCLNLFQFIISRSNNLDLRYFPSLLCSNFPTQIRYSRFSPRWLTFLPQLSFHDLHWKIVIFFLFFIFFIWSIFMLLIWFVAVELKTYVLRWNVSQTSLFSLTYIYSKAWKVRFIIIIVLEDTLGSILVWHLRLLIYLRYRQLECSA